MKRALATLATLATVGATVLSCSVDPPRAEPAFAGTSVGRAPLVTHPRELRDDDESPDLPDIVYEDSWRSTYFGGILLPKETLAVDDDGGVDVAVHFHGGQMATRYWRHSGLNAVIASAGYGLGSHAYTAAMSDGTRFTSLVDEALRVAGDAVGRKLHPRRILLVAWSAGYGAVEAILEKPALYDRIDGVVLLDGLHGDYKNEVDARSVRQPDPDNVDLTGLRALVRFAGEATEVGGVRPRRMVITHSSIMPPNYPGTTETSWALLTATHVPYQKVDEPGPRDMHLVDRADAGHLHVRGFTGRSAHDHIAHLGLVGDEVRRFVSRPWSAAWQQAGAPSRVLVSSK